MSNMSMKDSIYATLPKALTTQEVLVRSRQEDPEVLRQRQELVQSRSVSELAKISSLSEFPIPGNLQRLIRGSSKAKEETNEPK